MLIQNNRFQNFSYCLRFGVVLLATSVVAGLGGILLHEFLEVVEKVVLGHGEEAKALAVSQRQFILIVLAGCISAVIWYVLQRKNRQIISVKAQVKAETVEAERPVLLIHLANIFLQVASVGAGSPIGKEGAPRELGALGAGRLSDRFQLSLPDRSLAIICGASAGLAAVYQVPIASIFFAFETLGLGLSFLNILWVTLTTYLASLVAGLVISDAPLYQAGQVSLNLETCVLAIFLAALITPLAHIFRRLTQKAQAGKETHQAILWKLPLTFLLLASFALYFPEILGNGGALAQAVFDGMAVSYAIPILIIKACLVLLTLKNGAYGGTLTPSFSMGAVLGFLFAVLCQLAFPDISMNSAMLIGSSVFLAITMNAPLTAVGLVVSFTGQNLQALPVLLIAVAVAVCINSIFKRIERNFYVNPYRSQTRRNRR
ncbi:chloride channel protein [Streptococcus equinus]|uniref:chloride channel protein n=1 Tax=Streptococcus equinus TaxID=1335 RepID=UPI00215A836B|nr:chloride channel protein [Streptococcus equinus]UVF03437.1 chloride channel protein [Streptococcus equinus]